MSTPAVTLQCPNCGGVFLTLQHGGSGMEICPHCAVAAPRGSYRRVEGESAFPRGKTTLPTKRSAPLNLGVQPVMVEGHAATPPSMLPPVMQVPAPAWQPQESVAAAPPAWQPQPPPPAAAPTAWPYVFAPAPEVPMAQPPPPQPELPPIASPPVSEPAPATVFAPPSAPAFAPAPAPVFAPAPAAVAAPVFAPAPVVAPTPVFGPAPSVAQVPLFQPTSVPPPVEIAATSINPFAPLPPPQIGFAPPAEPTPFRPAAAPLPTRIKPSPGSFVTQRLEPEVLAPEPVSAPPPPPAAPPPVWPGLGAEVAATPVISPRPNPLRTVRRSEDALPAAPTSPLGWMEAQQVPLCPERPVPLEAPRRFPWLSVLIVLPILCGLGLTMWRASQPRLFAVRATGAAATTAAPLPPPLPPASVTPVPAPIPAMPPESPPSVAADTPPSSPPPATPQALPASGALTKLEAVAKIRTAHEVLASLDSAPTLDERLGWIADGQSHRESVARFFEKHTKGLQVNTMDPDVGLFSELPSGEDVKLLVAVTADCPGGAMVRLYPHGTRQILDWPLFEQTHELEFDKFVTTSGPTEPRWFSALCTRSRTSGLQGPAGEAHIAIRAQGSLSAGGEALIHVLKDSEVGRLLEARMVWGRVYLMKVQLERLELNGKPILMVLDCAGTATASK